MSLRQRRPIFPNGRVEKAAAGSQTREEHKQTSSRQDEAEEKKKVFLFLSVLNAQFFIFKGPADGNAAVSEVNWVHNGAINSCFVAHLDLANG